MAIADKEIKGYLYNKVNTGKRGKLYSFRSIGAQSTSTFSILFITFADYKKNTGQAEIIDGSHYLSKW